MNTGEVEGGDLFADTLDMARVLESTRLRSHVVAGHKWAGTQLLSSSVADSCLQYLQLTQAKNDWVPRLLYCDKLDRDGTYVPSANYRPAVVHTVIHQCTSQLSWGISYKYESVEHRQFAVRVEQAFGSFQYAQQVNVLGKPVCECVM
jgi:hypothetical protein